MAPEGEFILSIYITIASDKNILYFKDSTGGCYTVKNPPGAGPNIQDDGKRLIFRQTDSLVLRLPLGLMEFLMENTSYFLQCSETAFFRAVLGSTPHHPKYQGELFPRQLPRMNGGILHVIVHVAACSK